MLFPATSSIRSAAGRRQLLPLAGTRAIHVSQPAVRISGSGYMERITYRSSTHEELDAHCSGKVSGKAVPPLRGSSWEGSSQGGRSRSYALADICFSPAAAKRGGRSGTRAGL